MLAVLEILANNNESQWSFRLLIVKNCLQCFDAVDWAAGRALPVKTEWWEAGVIICLGEEQICIWPSKCHSQSLSLAPVNPDRFCLRGFTFLVLAHLGSPRQSPEEP